jgi:hypothetical protein
MEIKGITEEIFVRQLKTCGRNMQELTNSIKRTNLRIMDIEEGEEMQPNGICNRFDKILTENFPNLEEDSRTSNRIDQNRAIPQHIIIKTTRTKNIERIFKAVIQKKTNNI